jgi:ligand-binding sensor domain-containing protein
MSKRRFPSQYLACFFLLFLTAQAQYRFDSWATDNGLPRNSIQAMRQTRDGYLWLATMDGLARFDGVKFRVYNKVNTAAIGDNRFAVFARSAFADRCGNR